MTTTSRLSVDVVMTTMMSKYRGSLFSVRRIVRPSVSGSCKSSKMRVGLTVSRSSASASRTGGARSSWRSYLPHGQLATLSAKA